MTASSSNFGAKRQRTSDPSSESHHGSSLLRQPPKRVVLNNNNSQSAEFNVLGVAVESSNSLLLSPMIRNRSILNEKTFNRLAGLERKLDVTQPLQTTVSSFSSSSYSSASAAKDMILTTTASPLNILDSCSSKPPLLTSTEPLGIWASRLSPTTRKKCILSFCEAGKILETTGDFENALLNYKFAKGAVADERDASHQVDTRWDDSQVLKRVCFF